MTLNTIVLTRDDTLISLKFILLCVIVGKSFSWFYKKKTVEFYKNDLPVNYNDAIQKRSMRFDELNGKIAK